MTSTTGPVAPGGVFISYRRLETSHLAGRLYDQLVKRFGHARVFMDVDSIDPGTDFAEAINGAVDACGVLLALIGCAWLGMTDEQGRRRLDDPDDIVRLEIEAALQRNIRVIPLLVDGALMPRGQDLPDSLAKLSRRHALPIRHESFEQDVSRLLQAIEQVVPARPLALSELPRIARNPRAAQIFHHRKLVHAVAFSPDGRWLATGSTDKRARIWEVATGKERLAMVHRGGWEAVERVVFSPDRSYLATAGGHYTARVWLTNTGAPLLTRYTHDDSVSSVSFSPDGYRLATGSADKTARIWKTATGEQLIKVTDGRKVSSVAFSPDGRLLATGGQGQGSSIWDATTGEQLTRFTSDYFVQSVAFSPDGRLLATGNWGNTAQILEIATGERLTTFPHHGSQESVAFSPDGRLLATGSTDHMARIWDAATGEQLTKIIHDSWVHSLAFSPEGRWLATADGKARIWDLRPGSDG